MRIHLTSFYTTSYCLEQDTAIDVVRLAVIQIHPLSKCNFIKMKSYVTYIQDYLYLSMKHMYDNNSYLFYDHPLQQRIIYQGNLYQKGDIV